MKASRRNALIKYGIATLVCALMVWGVIAIRTSEMGAFSLLPLVSRYLILCDAFTVPGMLLILSGALVAISNEGALDGLSYLGHYLKNMFIPGKRDSTKKYYDYVQGKRGRNIHGFGFLFVVGGICMVIAAIFYGLFYTVY